MKKKIIIAVLLLLVDVLSIVLIIERNMIQKTSNFMFYLEEKYYGSGSFNEIGVNELTNLIDNKESFAIFIHQPFCAISYEFNRILTLFAQDQQISFYKISFEERI